ncbi:MAG TPA: 4-alpha-glucanotransferase [Pyrinomonadaceae bacterium]
MSFPRSSGILLHPTSLPGKFGIGDLGSAAHAFVDFLAASGQSLWQVLPLGPTGYGDSPYQCFSAFAGNTLLISPEQLMQEGLLAATDLSGAPVFSSERVDFGEVIKFKHALLAKTFESFRRTTNTGLRSDFETFCQQAASWLDDYALFRALKDAQAGRAWNEWDSALVRREPAAIARAREELREQIDAQKFYQYLFFKQWAALKAYCHASGIQLIGDIPIFVARDSADVWTNPEQFKLDQKGNPVVVAGVPPDYFSATGQLWGNPIYNWERMRADGFQWWLKRVRATLEIYDIVRIDHFRGFAASWEVPGADRTAERGRWVQVPGRELFAAIKSALGDLPIIAEDLGVITPDVEALRDDFGFPGMRILQFGFGGDSLNLDLPHNYIRNIVVYTGTHDNDTIAGWFESEAGAGSTRDAAQVERERQFCLDYLNADGREIHWDFIRAVLASVADTAIVPLQDLLGLGTQARMNLPASTNGNWAWRYRADALTEKLSARLRHLTELYGRVPTKE